MPTTPTAAERRDAPDARMRGATVRTVLGLDAGEPRRDRIYLIAPGALVLGPNVRTDARPDDREFAESIAEHGVLQPITCYLDGPPGAEELVVHMGGRRARFAAQVGRDTVPVLLLPKPPDADRIAEQVVENDRRAPLTVAERAAAAHQLAAFGLPAAQIARRLAMPRRDVDTALAVAASEKATAAASVYELDMEQAATVAELADDPRVVEQLLAAAADPDRGRGEFQRVAQQARDDRRDQAEREQVAARLRARGIRVTDQRPQWGRGQPGPRHLSQVGVDEAEHVTCPGHAVYLSQGWDGGADGGHGATVWLESPVCLDPATHHPARPVQTDLEAAARAQERADVLRTNREWRAAEQVRRRWLRELAQRKTPPAGADRFVLSCLLHCDPSIPRAFEWSSNHQLLRDLLGLDREPREDQVRDLGGSAIAAEADIAEILDQVATAPAKRLQVLLLVLVLAAWEERTSVQTWRTPTEQDRRYLRQLIDWGHEPALVERRILAEPST